MTPPQTTYPKRDEVLALRRGYAEGRCGFGHGHESNPCSSCQSQAARRYPLPKVERPRVVTTSDGWRYSIRDGVLHARGPYQSPGDPPRWTPASDSVDDIRLLFALIVSPVELVDDPGSVAGDD